MNFARKTLAFLAPERFAAVQRAEARDRYYESGIVGNHSTGRHVYATESADGSLTNAHGNLRTWGRYLDENHDIATGALDILCREIVGRGWSIEPMVLSRTGVPLESVNDSIREVFETFSRAPTVERDIDFNTAAWLSCRSWLRDGDMFARHITSGYPFRFREAPYKLQLLESEMCPWSLFNDQPNVVMGVQKGEWGEPVAYHFYREHPGSVISPLGLIGAAGAFVDLADTLTVEAAEVTHLKFSRRLMQTRGVTIFHSAIRRLEDMKDFEESEQIAAKMCADGVYKVTRSPDADFDPADLDANTSERNFYVQSGMVFDNLAPGEDIESLTHARPNPELTAFRTAMGRAAAAGIGVNASDMLRDYAGTYSSQRQELVSHRPQIEYMQNQFRGAFLQPIYERLVMAAVRAGMIEIDGSMDPLTLTKAAYFGPQMIWIDPKAEAAAAQIEIDLGIETRTGLIRRRGRNPRDIQTQLEVEAMSDDERETTTNEEQGDASGPRAA